MDEHEGLVWLHADMNALSGFLSYCDPMNGQIKPFCDAPEGFWRHRGSQTKHPLYNGIPVVLVVGANRQLRATARVMGNGSFKIAETIGSSFNKMPLPRSIVGRDGESRRFTDGIWLTDVKLINLEWPHAIKHPPASRIVRGSDWQILKRHTEGR